MATHSLPGYSPRGHKESDTIEHIHMHTPNTHRHTQTHTHIYKDR